jgi:hypothetical protein
LHGRWLYAPGTPASQLSPVPILHLVLHGQKHTTISYLFTHFGYMFRDKNVWRITGDGNDHKDLIGGVS